MNIEHIKVRCTLNQNIDDSGAPRTDTRLKLGQLVEGCRAIEEHEQTDRHNGIEIFRELVVP